MSNVSSLWATTIILLGPLIVIFALYCGALVVHLFIRARRRRFERPRPDSRPAGETRSGASDRARRDGG